jgi:hypothetical protein
MQQHEITRQLDALRGGSEPSPPPVSAVLQENQHGLPLESSLRRELERLLGYRPLNEVDPDDPMAGGTIPDFAAMESLAHMIEEGQPLPPQEFSMSAEPADEFVKRVNDSIKRFQRLMAGRKARKGRKHRSTPDPADADAFEVEWTEDDDEALKAWAPFSEVTVIPKEIEESRPAPDIPQHIEEQFERCQQALYVLRRAHLGNTMGPKKRPRFTFPGAPLDALAERGLVEEGPLVFDDPWVGIRGAAETSDYLCKAKCAGVEMELDTLFANFYQYE